MKSNVIEGNVNITTQWARGFLTYIEIVEV